MNHTNLTNCTYTITNFVQTKEKVLNWVQQFSTFCFLDNHQYRVQPHTQECLLGAGERRRIRINSGAALNRLQAFIDEKKSWVFGHLGYDLKNEIEELQSGNPDETGFPVLFFFEPEILIRLSPAEMTIEADDPGRIFREIMDLVPAKPGLQQQVSVSQRFSREEYLDVLEKLRQHILRGDCYEINFCQEFFARDACIDPLSVYKKLSTISPNPFSALYHMDENWLICASPERYLYRQGGRILSQPIKGTSKRVLQIGQQDEAGRDALYTSAKDRSENVMVVDLVRNDLAKICTEGSVQVDELFGVYSFPQVYQMISTISGELQKDLSFTEIIRATFPMGSMTGAPKKRVMELIEKYERTRRGIFSGALGYLDPSGDFDLNVVIRSIMYNAETRYLSFQAGSGITWYSEAEKEWEECLLKAEAIEAALRSP